MSTSQDRLFEVIALLRRTPTPLNLTGIARGVEIAPSSAHAILNTLRRHGIVTLDRDRRYGLGPALFYLGASYARNTDIYRAAWNEVLPVAHQLQVAVAIAVPWDDHHLILAVNQHDGPRAAVGIGSRVPLQAGSYGKAYYAWSDAETPAQLERFTETTITDPDEYRQEIERTRERGYAIDLEEFVTGVAAVAVGVTSANGYEGLAAMMSPVDHMNEIGIDRAGKALAACASKASVILGDRGREQSWGETF